MLISKTLPGLYNGVSQQPSSLRDDTQCSLQENAFPSLVHGLFKRPPTEFISLLSSKAGVGSFIHTINRDAGEQYVVVITADSTEPIEVFRLDGTKCTVKYGQLDDSLVFTSDPSVKDYLGVPDSLKAVTIADYTIIVNTAKKTVKKSIVDGSENPQGIVYIKNGIAEQDYKILINGSVQATYTTPTSDNTAGYKTTTIASTLKNNLEANLGDLGWSFELLGSSIVLTPPTGTNFRLDVEDSWGNNAMVGIKNVVQKFTDLPPKAPDGFVVEISGDEENHFDNYYVMFKADERHSPGIWVETVKPGLKNTLEETSLPHRLVRTGDNEFTFAPCLWEKREVGDDKSCPDPGFVDRTINDVFFFNNRLGFLSGENVVLSRASEYFNFWPSTATDILDNDPIDVAVASTQVATLRHAIPFNMNLLLFSDQQQFILSSADKLLTPRTIAINPTTRYEVTKQCKPVGIGSNAYFITPNGDYSSMYEYFVQPESLVYDANNVTNHVPRYLPKNIQIFEGSITSDMIFVGSSDEPNSLYVYNFTWDRENKIQSAWHKWIFDDSVVNVSVLENLLYLIMKNEGSGEVYLATINLEKMNSQGLSFRVHLDKQVYLKGIYDPGTERTTWTLPYTDSNTNFEVVEGSKGNLVINVSKEGNILSAPGDYSGVFCFIGKNYSSKYRFSEWFIKDQSGVPNLQGRLQLRTFTLSFTNTSSFNVVITPKGREPFNHVYSGIVLGATVLGQPSLLSDKKKFVVMSRAIGTDIDVVNASYLPCEFQSASMEGYYSSRSRPV